jgi:integral membrane protein (TIGR01906 family)
MKFIETPARFIFILTLPILFIAASIAWGFNSLWIYEYGFNKYDVSQTSQLSDTELKMIGQEMIKYFNSRDEFIKIEISRNTGTIDLFNTEEKIHFKDVKDLVKLDYTILLVTFILALSYVLFSIFWRNGKRRQVLAKSVIWGSGISLVLILVIGLASFTNFDQLFLKFHYLVFTNPYWSTEGYMLTLFGDLWFDAVLIGIGFMTGLAIISSLPAIAYLRLKTNRSSVH